MTLQEQIDELRDIVDSLIDDIKITSGTNRIGRLEDLQYRLYKIKGNPNE